MLVYFLTLILFISQILDAYTTLVIIKRGGREMNPILRAAFEEFGTEEILLVKGIAVTVLGYFLARNGMPEATIAMIAVYVAVLAYNWRSMPK